MVSFTEAFLLLAQEGGKDFEHPVFMMSGTHSICHAFY